jgi:beta-glucanase (GH16 family)
MNMDLHNKRTADGWKLIFFDEFEGDIIDRSKWGNEIGFIRNNELQYYTDRPGNAYIENSCLIICGRREDYKTAAYTSASLNTQGRHDFKYGRIEMCAKLPYGKGIWPAFWTLGTDIDEVDWPECGEIDIMELIGGEGNVGGEGGDNLIYANLHYTDGESPNENNSYVLPKEKGRFCDDFHVIGCEWDEQEIKFYVDDNIYFRGSIADKPYFQKPHYILLNLAIGGEWAGDPAPETIFPQYYYIDWVRVYQK